MKINCKRLHIGERAGGWTSRALIAATAAVFSLTAALLYAEYICPGMSVTRDYCKTSNLQSCDQSDYLPNGVCKKWCIVDQQGMFCPASGSCCQQGPWAEVACRTVSLTNVHIYYYRSDCDANRQCLRQWHPRSETWGGPDLYWDLTLAVEQQPCDPG